MLPPFSTLLDAHLDELVRHARRLSGDRAEDVVQEALLRALRSYPRLRRDDHLRAWLYRIVTTTAFDMSSPRRERPVGSLPERATNDHDDAGFAALLDEVPAKARPALELRFVQDLSYDQIAARLGCSSAAARQRVSSAIRELRRRMA